MEDLNQQPNKMIPIIVIAGIVVLILVGLVMYMNSRKASITDTITPTPSTSIPVTSVPNNTRPTLIPTVPITYTPDSTGGNIPTFPPEEIVTADQKIELQKRLPVRTADFTISFDYAEDSFLVNLQQPADQSREAFNTWLNTNYPSLDIALFTFQ